MKRNSTSIKHSNNEPKSWGERPSAPLNDNFPKSRFDTNSRGSVNQTGFKTYEPLPPKNEYYSHFNLREPIPAPSAMTATKLREEHPRFSNPKPTEPKTRTSSFRHNFKHRIGADSLTSPDADPIPSLNANKASKKPRTDSETVAGHRLPSRDSFPHSVQKRPSHEPSNVLLPKVTLPEKHSKSIQIAKNSSAALSNAFKELANLSVQQMQTYASQQSFMSSVSNDPSQTASVSTVPKNQKAPKTFSENVRPNPADNRSVSTDISQPHMSLNAGLPNKIVSLMPARSSSFLFNGREALYAVNTTNGLIRTYNEDRVSIVINIKRKADWKAQRWPNCSYFSVFDGHGGALCADFLKDNLHKMILESPHFPENPVAAIEQGCAQAEHDFSKFALKQTNIEKSGSCGLILLIIDEKVYIGNVGDSRAIASEFGGKVCLNLTKDHKPESPSEKERIEKAGGKVMKNNYLDTYKFLMPMLNNRLNELPFRLYPGGLSVSRSFGDLTAKDVQLGGNPNVLIAKPDVFVYTVEKKTDFIFIGCELTRRRNLRQMGHTGHNRRDLAVREQGRRSRPQLLSDKSLRRRREPCYHVEYETTELRQSYGHIS